MNEIAAGLSVALLRMSLFLGAAALAVQLLLKFARPGSSRVHRVAWLLVLLQGWFWWRLPVTIPCYEPAVVKQVASAPITPITLPETPIAVPDADPIAGLGAAASPSPAKTIPWHVVRPYPVTRMLAIDTPRPVDRPASPRVGPRQSAGIGPWRSWEAGLPGCSFWPGRRSSVICDSSAACCTSDDDALARRGLGAGVGRICSRGIASARACRFGSRQMLARCFVLRRGVIGWSCRLGCGSASRRPAG